MSTTYRGRRTERYLFARRRLVRDCGMMGGGLRFDAGPPRGCASPPGLRHGFVGFDTLGYLVTQHQAHLPIKPVGRFVIHRPTLPLQEYMKTPVAVAHPDLGQVFGPNPYSRLLVCHTPMPAGGFGQDQNLAGPPLVRAVGDLLRAVSRLLHGTIILFHSV